MVRQAVLTIPGLTASDIEVNRAGRSFSIDTIRLFKHRSDPEPNLFFIMGTDAFFFPAGKAAAGKPAIGSSVRQEINGLEKEFWNARRKNQ